MVRQILMAHLILQPKTYVKNFKRDLWRRDSLFLLYEIHHPLWMATTSLRLRV